MTGDPQYSTQNSLADRSERSRRIGSTPPSRAYDGIALRIRHGTAISNITPLTPWKPSWATNGRISSWERPCSPVNSETRFSDWWWTVDRLQLAAIIALILAGVILSLAASPQVATRIGLDPFHFFNHHVLFLLPSFIVMIGVSFLSPRQIRRTALIVFAVSIA